MYVPAIIQPVGTLYFIAQKPTLKMKIQPETEGWV